MQNRIIIQMLVAAAMIFGVQTAANAQFGGLLKKAKKALNIEVTTGDSDESTTSSESSSEPSTSMPKKLKDLNQEMFIYQPVDDPVNTPFYDINDPRVKQYYDQFCGLNNRRVKTPTEYYWLFEFLDYQSPAKGLKQVHCTEYPLVAYYSYAMMHPKDVLGFRCYIRARITYENLSMSPHVRTLPMVQGRLGWSLEYPQSDEMRKITLKDGTTLSLLETEKARVERWKNLGYASTPSTAKMKTIWTSMMSISPYIMRIIMTG